MMEKYFELAASIVQNFIMVWFISNFCGYKYEGLKRYMALYGVCILGTCIISAINHFVSYDGLLSACSVGIFIIYAQLFLVKNIWLHIFVSLYSMVIVFAISSVSLLVGANIFTISLENLMTDLSVYRIIVVCFCRIIEFLTFKLILAVNNKYALTYKEWILFTFVAVLTWIEVILFTRASMVKNEIVPYMVGASIAALIINALIYYFIIYVNKAMQLKTEFTLLKMQYKNTKLTETNMKALYDSTYNINHDLEKHFMYIRTMEEKGESGAVIEYIDKILGDKLLKMNKIMFADDDIFNVIINTRLEICRLKKISPMVRVDGNAIEEIDSEDIMILFGNLFDNAIEAAEKTEQKIIILNVQTQGDYISIYMENSFNGEVDKNLKTSKVNKMEHGFGMKNVKKIVNKYDGMIKCFTDRQMFCCDILLKRRNVEDTYQDEVREEVLI